MMYRLTAALLITDAWFCAPLRADLTLIEDGQAASVIVLDDPDSDYLSLAAEELQHHLQRAAGVAIPIENEQEARDRPETWARLHIGPNAWTRSADVTADDLAPEHYRIEVLGRHIIFLGHDVPANNAGPLDRYNSPATFWAVGAFLDRELGVRWLWPGPLGTHVPTRRTITVSEISLTRGPRGIWREFNTNHLEQARRDEQIPRLQSDAEFEQLLNEAMLWKKRHQMAIHRRLPFGHAFNEWWGKYGQEHPDYFAAPPPDGPEMPWPRANRVKLRLGNPAVVERIVQEWREGNGASIWGKPFRQPRPDFWGVAPTDGTGFCTHATSRRMDEGPAVDAAPQSIWDGQVNLTPRYLKFWRQVLDGIHREDPNVTLCTYAYGPYTEPPEGAAFHGKLAIGIVNDYWDRRGWQGWHEAGAKIFLRPNWWCTGAGAPHLPLRMQGEYARSIYQTDIIGYHYDGMTGHWATQGAIYYLNARLAVRPDLSVDEIIEEYVSAFGAAGSTVGQYLEYWEDFEADAAMGVIEHPGGWEGPRDGGLYETLTREHDINPQPIIGSYLVLPYLFTDQVLTSAAGVLERAATEVTGDPTAQARVAFLQAGLAHTALTRDVLRHAYGQTKDRQKHKELAAELKQMRRELTRQHAVWGEATYAFEWRRRLATDRWHSRWDR